MELPLSRFQSINICQTHNTVKFQTPFSTSNPIFFSGFRTNPPKFKYPFSRICFSLVNTDLQPKPTKPRENTQLEDTHIAKLASGICDQIETLVSNKKYHEAFELFEILEVEGGYEGGNATLDALIRACIGLRSVRGVKRVCKFMFNNGFKLDQYLSNRVLCMHVKCGMMVDARKVFDEMPQRNLVSWNTIIGGLVDVGAYIDAFELFFQMWCEFSDGDSRTFSIMISAVAGLGLSYPGRQLHSCVVKMGVSDDVFVACALIDMYSKCGRIWEARIVFDEMPVKTTVGWNSMIAGYALNGYSEEGLSLYYEMQESGVPMDHFTFSIVIRICARLGSLEHAKQAHGGSVRHGFTLDVVANTALVDLYSKWGRIEDARNVFDSMPCKNLISWNALIAGYGNHGRGEEAIELFNRMLREGMRPNHVTFLAILSACSYSGLFDLGWEIFDSMSRVHGVTPRAMHYACMIELLGREEHLDEALALIRDAPVEPTANMWASLLTACRVHKNLELGRFAIEELYRMGPEKLSNYVVLLNIYKSMGKKEEASSVVDTLKQKGLRILPACTWIEVKKQSHAFVSCDSSHAQNEDIYKKLDSLLHEISKHGYSPVRRSHLPDVDEKEEHQLLYHSEKLAVAFGIINTADHVPLQLVQSHRICDDCHRALKLIAKVTNREIVVRDASRFHRFRQGSCSCGDYW